MEAKAITRHIRQSPRKIRILLDDLRGVKVDKAMNYLHFSKAKAAYQIEKTLSSAVANLMNKSESENLSVDSIYVKECYADGAPHLKRFRAASMGRISKINKKSSHLTIIVSSDKN
ncbi:MAG: 50S ribosomal protein L22 [Candidatus Neomarinimicrobiota bacterium]|nr:MAG: 50S ribosomal protein L22 [Candidatus Marinimicrobia bacterium TMED108]RCL90302.1 MAG: 50S ribosomal protein L22 [bacterium]|tara:strand:- start:582 stop:929 length:348 start_codon:yes stop_codon:yes gene_type:complete